jgi:hypothetical protein
MDLRSIELGTAVPGPFTDVPDFILRKIEPFSVI